MNETNSLIPWEEYFLIGSKRAVALGNRGPLSLDESGQLAQDILNAYYEHGFYVFKSVLSPDEIKELTIELDAIMENAPVSRDKSVDHLGRPSKFAEYYSLTEDEPPVCRLLSHPIMMSDATLRASAHPQILKMVSSINGPDFIPFTEVIQYKVSHSGAPTHWHQDGRTHWTQEGLALEQPDGSGKTHGFNLSIACTNCVPENCLWVVPGSQREWRITKAGKFPPITEQIPEAVPVLMKPGDCVIVNRSSLHGSYPNKSSERRMTLLLGYHNRASAVGVETTNVHAFIRTGATPVPMKYTVDRVLKRSRMIPLAIDARRQRYPEEAAFEYQGTFIGGADWNEQARSEITEEGNEYWQLDMTL